MAAGNSIYSFSGTDGEINGFQRVTFTGNIRDGDETTVDPDLGSNSDTIIDAMEIQPDGKILVAGLATVTIAADD